MRTNGSDFGGQWVLTQDDGYRLEIDRQEALKAAENRQYLTIHTVFDDHALDTHADEMPARRRAFDSWAKAMRSVAAHRRVLQEWRINRRYDEEQECLRMEQEAERFERTRFASAR